MTRGCFRRHEGPADPAQVAYRFADRLSEAVRPGAVDPDERVVGEALWPLRRVIVQRPVREPGTSVLRFEEGAAACRQGKPEPPTA